ncbi:MAG: glycosyltransferase family 2 protein, partial [Lachnospiraceae bacterium]|nr:glycosyltransferase family 2 protein [Lachnospiraceae bacterium]
MTEAKTIDVIIPVYKPNEELLQILEKLKSQTLKPKKVIIVNTEKAYYDTFAKETGIETKYGEFLEVYHVAQKDFDHGMTRRLGVEKSDAELFVMMTQDAVPKDERLLEKLTANLTGKVA